MSCIEVAVVVQLDKFSAETSWSIDSSDGLANFITRPVGYYEEMKSQKIIETVYLPEGLEYQFKISDFMGELSYLQCLFNYNQARLNIASCKSNRSKVMALVVGQGTGGTVYMKGETSRIVQLKSFMVMVM